MELIRTELERFIGEQNIERSFGGFENIHEHEDFPAPAPVYEVFKPAADFKANDGGESHEEIRNYNAPVIDDYKQLTQAENYDYKHQPKHDDLFMERPFRAEKTLSSPHSNYLDQRPNSGFRPDKLLELIPMEQRHKYPVEVEEISYEEYLELSKRGDTFEEPLYDDEDVTEVDVMDHFNDPMVGFDSNNNVVKLKYEDPLSDLSRPRLSRRNDGDQFSYFDKDLSRYEQYLPSHSPQHQTQSGRHPEARALVSPITPLLADSLTSVRDLSIQDTRRLLETATGMLRVMEVDNNTDTSNRRMDTGTEDYEYIDLYVDNRLREAVNIDNDPIKDSSNEEKIDMVQSDDGDTEEANKVTNIYITSDPDIKEEDNGDKMDDILHTTTKSTELMSPRPIYVVYPDTTAPTTENTSTTTATTSPRQGSFSDKMFDIEYDQFS